MTERVEILTIGGLATRLGVAPSTIRKWERGGMIPPATRITGSDRRVYLAADIALIRERIETRRRRRREEGARTGTAA